VRLAARHNVALLVLRALDEPAVDDVLRSACDFVEEVQIPCVGPSLRDRLINRVRLRAALLRGMPTWAAERNAPGFGARLEELVREWRPDVVQFEYRIMGQFLPAIAGSAPSLLVEHDPVRAERGRSALFGPVEERAWKSLGHAVSRQADSLVVFTERDRKTLSELSGSTPIARIPLGYTLPYPALDPAGTDPHGIVCVGSFIHPPNIDAALWLGREIFPFVKSRIPAASLQLVGSHAPPAVHALDQGDVTVSTEVPDVRPYLDAAAVVAAPVRLGGGMRVKVLEAVASGKAIVATPLALEGLELRDGEHVLVAETGTEFADALVELLMNVDRRTAIAEAARRWAEKNLDQESRARAYEALYTSLVGDALPRRRKALIS
jgi:glycosyltransferase involved in cell wall biosynthesis